MGCGGTKVFICITGLPAIKDSLSCPLGTPLSPGGHCLQIPVS